MPYPLATVARAISAAALAPSAVGVVFAPPRPPDTRRDTEGEQAVEVELHVSPLDGGHPADHLLGFRAPDTWHAFGVTVTGQTVPYPRHPPPPLIDDGLALAVTFLVDRSGATVTALAPDRAEVTVLEHPTSAGHSSRAGPTPTGGPVEGLVADLCRRVLALPTPPPERPVAELWGACWLDRIVSWTLDDPGRPPSWEVVAALHPGVSWAADGDPTLVATPGITLAGVGRAIARTVDWELVRTGSMATDLAGADLAPDVLEWMDDGTFSRWALGRLPELGDLRAVVAEILPARIAALVDDTLRAWGIDW